MILAGHSDSSFLKKSKSHSQSGAHIFLSEDVLIPFNNGPLLTLAQIIKFGMSSVSESELAPLFITVNQMNPLHKTIIKMGWPQP